MAQMMKRWQLSSFGTENFHQADVPLPEPGHESYCKHTRFSSTHFLRFPVFLSSAGTLPVSGCSGIHEIARCYIPSASAQ